MAANYFYTTKSSVTADFMVDAIEELWPCLKQRFNPHILVINAEKGPENDNRTNQTMNQPVDFSTENSIDINLAYHPSYHGKYNLIERVWGVLKITETAKSLIALIRFQASPEP